MVEQNDLQRVINNSNQTLRADRMLQKNERKDESAKKQNQIDFTAGENEHIAPFEKTDELIIETSAN